MPQAEQFTIKLKDRFVLPDLSDMVVSDFQNQMMGTFTPRDNLPAMEASAKVRNERRYHQIVETIDFSRLQATLRPKPSKEKAMPEPERTSFQKHYDRFYRFLHEARLTTPKWLGLLIDHYRKDCWLSFPPPCHWSASGDQFLVDCERCQHDKEKGRRKVLLQRVCIAKAISPDNYYQMIGWVGLCRNCEHVIYAASAEDQPLDSSKAFKPQEHVDVQIQEDHAGQINPAKPQNPHSLDSGAG